MNNDFNIKTYIVHCKSLISRKHYMLNQLEKLGFSNYEFYENYDGNELKDNDIACYYSNNLQEQYDKYKMWFPYEPTRILKKSDISVTIKYCEIYKKIADGNDDFAIIFEDDSILDENFCQKFNTYMKQIQNFDMIFMASGCDLHAKNIISECNVYKMNHPSTRCVGATAVKKKTCQDLLKTILPFHLCIDWELNYQLYKHNHEVFWFEPPIVTQGSESGLFKTSMR